FMGGYEMETLSLGLPFMAAFLNPGAWGRPFTAAMEGYPRMAGMWLVGEDMPQETNRITLDPKAKDKFGLPVASDRRKSAQPPVSPVACGSTQPRSFLPPVASGPGKPWMRWS